MNPPTNATNHFIRWLFELQGRLADLDRDLDRAHASGVEDRLNTLRAMTSNLLDYAEQHDVNLTDYNHQFTDIYRRFSGIERRLEQRKQPWWKRAINVVISIINLIAISLGFGPALPLLGSPERHYLSAGYIAEPDDETYDED
jgi:hypothetical protein